MQISATSLYRGSRPSSSVRRVAPGSVARTAVMMSALFSTDLTKMARTTSRVHPAARPAAAGNSRDSPWQVTAAAP